MARRLNRLTAVEVRGISQKGMHHDGGGLYLQVSAGGAKSWIFRFTLDGRAREMGLGPVHAIPLAEARKRATECRRMRVDGIDPIEARSAHRGWKKLEAAKAMTFDACAAAYIAAHEASWRNAKHREQWRNTLSSYAGPVFGSLPVQSIDVGLVMKALEPIWHTKPETATRLRGRIEAVLDWATVRSYRNGENPAHLRPGSSRPGSSNAAASVSSYVPLPGHWLGLSGPSMSSRRRIPAPACDCPHGTPAPSLPASGLQRTSCCPEPDRSLLRRRKVSEYRRSLGRRRHSYECEPPPRVSGDLGQQPAAGCRT
jgi:hypothetical protein